MMAETRNASEECDRFLSPSWEDIKDRFFQLYIREKKKLEDVRVIIADESGFQASSEQYYKHMRRSKIRKNLQARDREAILLSPEAKNHKTPTVLPHHHTNGLDLKHLRRYLGRNGVTERSQLTKRYERIWNQMLSQTQNVPVTLDDRFGISLQCFRSCLDCIISDWTTVKIFEDGETIPRHEATCTVYGTQLDYQFIDFFLNAIRIVSRTEKWVGKPPFYGGEDLVRQHIKQRPLTVVLQFLEFYVEDRWDQRSLLRTSLTKYFATIADDTCVNWSSADAISVNGFHCLSVLFNYWIQHEVIKETLPHLLQLMSEKFDSNLVTDVRGKAFLQAEIAWKYVDIGCHQQAKMTASIILQDSGSPVDIKVSALRCLSAIRLEEGDVIDAIALVKKATALCSDHPTAFLIPEESVRLMKDLARLLWRAGQHEAACQQYWRAFYAARIQDSFKEAEVCVFYLDLKRALECCNDATSLKILESYHSSVFTECR